jgi:O-methyltransferase involved in polyketide biosynthesis
MKILNNSKEIVCNRQNNVSIAQGLDTSVYRLGEKEEKRQVS